MLSVAQSSLRLPLLINMAEEAADSDVDSSQQSNASDDQQLEDSSQVRYDNLYSFCLCVMKYENYTCNPDSLVGQRLTYVLPY